LISFNCVTTSPNLTLKVLWRRYDLMIAYRLGGSLGYKIKCLICTAILKLD